MKGAAMGAVPASPQQSFFEHNPNGGGAERMAGVEIFAPLKCPVRARAYGGGCVLHHRPVCASRCLPEKTPTRANKWCVRVYSQRRFSTAISFSHLARFACQKKLVAGDGR